MRAMLRQDERESEKIWKQRISISRLGTVDTFQASNFSYLALLIPHRPIQSNPLHYTPLHDAETHQVYIPIHSMYNSFLTTTTYPLPLSTYPLLHPSISSSLSTSLPPSAYPPIFPPPLAHKSTHLSTSSCLLTYPLTFPSSVSYTPI